MTPADPLALLRDLAGELDPQPDIGRSQHCSCCVVARFKNGCRRSHVTIQDGGPLHGIAAELFWAEGYPVGRHGVAIDPDSLRLALSRAAAWVRGEPTEVAHDPR